MLGASNPNRKVKQVTIEVPLTARLTIDFEEAAPEVNNVDYQDWQIQQAMKDANRNCNDFYHFRRED